MAKVTFKTKSGKVVSFNKKNTKSSKTLKGKRRSGLRKSSKKVKKVKSAKSRVKRSTMARRKRTVRRRSSSVLGSTMMNTILGGAIAGIVGEMIPYGNVGKVAAGYVVGKKGGILGATGKAVAVIGAANFTKENMGSMLPSVKPLQGATATSW
jgi:hypothetical protein